MPSLEESLRTHLVGDPATAAAIRDSTENEVRLWPNERPAGNKTTPAIVFQVVANIPQNNVDGDDSGLEQGRVQLSIFGKTFDEAVTLRELVRSRMRVAFDDGSRALLVMQQGLVDQETRESRELLDFSIWHKTA